MKWYRTIKGIKFKDLFRINELKNIKLLRIFLSSNYNDKDKWNIDKFKYLLDWVEQEYIGDENGLTILEEKKYHNELDNYIITDIEYFDNICINVSLVKDKLN